MNRRVYKLLCEDQAPIGPVVHRSSDAVGTELWDVTRSRARALYHNRFPIPVFHPTDEFVPRTEKVVGDYMRVSRPGGADFLGTLLYRGARVYPRGLVEFFLRHGVIGWSDVTHTLTAKGHLPADS